MEFLNTDTEQATYIRDEARGRLSNNFASLEGYKAGVTRIPKKCNDTEVVLDSMLGKDFHT